MILFEGPTTKITFTRHNMIVECVLSFERLITKCAPARPSYNSTAPQHHHAVHDLTDIERASQSACLSRAAIVACFRLAHGPPPHIPTNCPVTGAHNFPTFLPKILIAKFALPQEDLINTSAPARHPLPVFDNQNMLIMPATLCFFAVRFKTEDRVFVLIPDLASKTFLLNVSAVFVRASIEHSTLLNMFAVSVRASIERSPTLLNMSAVFVRASIEHPTLLNMFAVSVRASIERSPTLLNMSAVFVHAFTEHPLLLNTFAAIVCTFVESFMSQKKFCAHFPCRFVAVRAACSTCFYAFAHHPCQPVASYIASRYFSHATAHFPHQPVVLSVSPGVALQVRADFAPSPWPLSLPLDPQSTHAPTFPPSPWPPTPPPDIQSARAPTCYAVSWPLALHLEIFSMQATSTPANFWSVFLDVGDFRPSTVRLQFDPFLRLLGKRELPLRRRLHFSPALFCKCLMLLPLYTPTHGCTSVSLPFLQPPAILQRSLQLFPAQALRVVDLVPQGLQTEVDRSVLWRRADALLDDLCPTREQPLRTALPARTFLARSPPSGWLLDCGASTVVTSDAADLSDVVFAKIPISALATTESASAEGTVRLQFKEGKSLNMPALLVKNATSKLVPFAPFIKAGYWILATEQGALVIDKDTHETLTFAPADSEGMYWLSADAVPRAGHTAHAARPTALPLQATTHSVWHARLNHPSTRTMNTMIQHNMVIGLVFAKSHKDEFPCLACLYGRMTFGPVQSPGPPLLRTVKELPPDSLDVVFLDVYGPVRTVSAGYRYITISYIRGCRVLRVDKLKSLDVPSITTWYDRLRARLSKETNGLKILSIHSDSFASFIALRDYAASHGTYWDFSRPPKHCFVAERQVRRFMESFRCTFLFSGLPRKYWVFLLSAIEFTLNLQPFEDAHISRFQQFTKFRPDGLKLMTLPEDFSTQV